MKTIGYKQEVLRRLGRQEGQAQTVIFDAIIAPPRSGSTRTGLIFQATDADLVITEPAARFDDGDARWPMLWKFFYEQIVALEQAATTEQRDLAQKPLRIVSKFISHHIGAIHEADEILDLHNKIAFLVRNPLEAMESNIVMLWGLTEVFANHEAKGVKGFPARISDMKKHHWVHDDADLSHLVESADHPTGSSVWSQHLEHMKSERDYSSLTVRAWILHHGIFSTPSLQREVWEYQRQGIERNHGKGTADRIAANHGYGTWSELVEAYLGTDYTAMQSEDFPAILGETFLHRQSGWNALEEIYERAQKHPDKYRIYDFGLLKLSPEQMTARLARDFGLEYRALAENQDVSFVTGYGNHLDDRPGMEQQIFGMAKKRGEILPCFNPLISIERFPPFVRRDILDNQLRVYLQALSDSSLARPEGTSTHALIGMTPHEETQPLREVDPAYSYILVQVATDMTPRLKRVVLANIRKRHEQAFGVYFAAIDQICEQGRRKARRGRHTNAVQSQIPGRRWAAIARTWVDLKKKAKTSPAWAAGQLRTAADILTITSGLVTNPSVGRLLAGLIGMIGSRVLSVYGRPEHNRALIAEGAPHRLERFVMENTIQVSNAFTILALTGLLSSGISSLVSGQIAGGVTETSLAIYIMTAFLLKTLAPELNEGESLVAALKAEGATGLSERFRAWVHDRMKGPANLGVDMLQGSAMFMFLDAVVRSDLPRMGTAALLYFSNAYFGMARRSEFQHLPVFRQGPNDAAASSCERSAIKSATRTNG